MSDLPLVREVELPCRKFEKLMRGEADAHTYEALQHLLNSFSIICDSYVDCRPKILIRIEPNY